MLVYDFREESKQKERQLAFALHAFSTPLECLRTKKNMRNVASDSREKNRKEKSFAWHFTHDPGFVHFFRLLSVLTASCKPGTNSGETCCIASDIASEGLETSLPWLDPPLFHVGF